MSSKYDTIKLKVHVTEEHYYILSRFLLSKMLTFCKIPNSVAVRISLQVKKHFVDVNRKDIRQDELVTVLENIMASKGYDRRSTALFRVITRFYTERIPLVLLIAGSASCGKTAVAHSLSSRLNSHNVVNTHVLLDITEAIEDCYGAGDGAGHAAAGVVNEALAPPQSSSLEVDTWVAECLRVQSAVESELNKSVDEGKVLIVEGRLLNVALFARYLSSEFVEDHGAIILAFVLRHSGAPSAEPIDFTEGEACSDRSVYLHMGTNDGSGKSNSIEQFHMATLKQLFPDRVCELPVCSDEVGISANATPRSALVYDVCVCHNRHLVEIIGTLHDIVIEHILTELQRRGVECFPAAQRETQDFVI